ncbi:hypothetical protein AB4Z30_29510 [Paenibacillus sp. 2TAF8]|uniref:hypothetical protein n=1 Tax=Paenibacillus sp. 2TAF8 TaxID=3233020 RepID=UPI003F9C3410
MDIQQATEEKLERAMQRGVPMDAAILEDLMQKKLLTEEATQRLSAQRNYHNKEARENVVPVRITDDVMNMMDALITSKHSNSRSEAASYFNHVRSPKPLFIIESTLKRGSSYRRTAEKS